MNDLMKVFLAYLGFLFGENWEVIAQYSEYISIPIAILLLIFGFYFVRRHIKHKKKMYATLKWIKEQKR